jgi:hypothetical protein
MSLPEREGARVFFRRGHYSKPVKPAAQVLLGGPQPASPVAPLRHSVRDSQLGASATLRPQTALSRDFHLWQRGCSISPDLQERRHMCIWESKAMNPAPAADA